MIYKYRDAKIFYKFINRKSDETIIILHGWGCDHKILYFLQDYIKDQNLLYIDLPPFGKTHGDVSDWTIFTYANMTISLTKALKINHFNLIGHSFGGRIAILITTLCKNEAKKLVLVDSAGLKPKRNIGYYLKVATYKYKKKHNMDISKYGSKDFQILPPKLKALFINIVNTDLEDFLQFIKIPTLIIFGEKDKETPIYMAKKFNKKIKNSSLFILKNSGHFCFLEQKIAFVSKISAFLEVK